jgi:hypothetical protein
MGISSAVRTATLHLLPLLGHIIQIPAHRGVTQILDHGGVDQILAHGIAAVQTPVRGTAAVRIRDRGEAEAWLISVRSSCFWV